MKHNVIVNFFEHFADGLYVRAESPEISCHGFFTDGKSLRDAMEALPPDSAVYFMGQKVDQTKISNNVLVGVKKPSIKMEDLAEIWTIVIGIDPLHGTENVDGVEREKNLTISENVAVVDDARRVKKFLAGNGISNAGIVDSGNGAYVVIPVRMSVSDGRKIAKDIVETVKRKVQLGDSQVQAKSTSLVRCYRMPGTLSKIGTARPSIPYRHAAIIEDWNGATPVELTALEYVVKKNGTARFFRIDVDGESRLDFDACVKECEQAFATFKAESGLYARAVKPEGYVDVELSSSAFRQEIRIFLRGCTGEEILPESLVEKIVIRLQDAAYAQSIKRLAVRSWYDKVNQEVWYDVGNNRQAIRIDASGWAIVEKPFAIFEPRAGAKAQMLPTKVEAAALLKHLDMLTTLERDDVVVWAVFLCACFLGRDFPMPIMSINGPQGSAKTTTSRQMIEIVDPQENGIVALGENRKEMAIILATRLLTCFDNLGSIRAETANLLCQAVTGGVYTTRELYTTKDEATIRFRSNLIVNGIDLFSRQPDLMERCLLLEMPRIDREKRKTLRQIDAVFRECLPSILGGVFDAISKALAMPDIADNELGRMADFEGWAIKFAVAMGIDEPEIRRILKNNRGRVVEAISLGDVTIWAIKDVMTGKAKLESGYEEFFSICRNRVMEKGAALEKDAFPKSASAFSRRIGMLADNLAQLGLTVRVSNVGPRKVISLYNDGSAISNGGGF